MKVATTPSTIRFIASHAIALVFFLLMEPPALAQVQSSELSNIDFECKKILEQQAIQEWRKIRTVTNSLQVDCKESEVVTQCQTDGTNKTERTHSRVWELVVDNHSQFRMISQTTPDIGHFSRYCANDKYRFQVFRRAMSEPYRLGSCSSYSNDTTYFTLDDHERLYTFPIQEVTHISAIPLEELLNPSIFTLLKCEKLRESNDPTQEYVLLQAKYTGSPKGETVLGTIYTAKLDPKRKWTICDATISFPDNNRFKRQDISYQQDFDGSPFPLTFSSLLSGINKNDVYTSLKRYSFAVPHVPTYRSEEFYLPYYNIPEAVLGTMVTNQRTRLITCLIGIVMILIGIFFYRVANRHRGVSAD